MKYLFLLLLLISGVCYGQTTYYIQADSVRFRKIGANSDFILENSTRTRTGAYLKNRWNGRTEFGYAVDSGSVSGSDLILWRGNGTQNITLAGIGASGWNLTGNASTVDGTNFIGTTDDIPLNFRVNNEKSGRVTSLGQTFFGYQAGNVNTNNLSTGFGYKALTTQVAGGLRNTAVGYSALELVVTGDDNVAIGYRASQAGGASNVAIGSNAMLANATGNFGVAIGVNAASVGTSLGGITAIGAGALENTTDGHNTAVGWFALNDNTSGTRNIGVGGLALSKNITANDNVAVGEEALSLNETSSSNTAIGTYSMITTTGGSGQNTAVGYSSLYSNTTGHYNTAVGYDALRSNITGGINVAIGINALRANLSDKNTAVGAGALEVNTTGNHNTAVGFDALYQNKIGTHNTAMGWNALAGVDSSSYNIGIGHRAGGYLGGTAMFNSGSDYNIFIGHDAGYSASQDFNATNSIAIGKGTYTTASNQIILGNSSITETRFRGAIYFDDAVGTAGQVLTSGGAGVSPTWETGGGGGDVTKVGTPVNNQIGIWTGDGTIKGSTALTFDGNTLYTNAAATQGVLFQVAGLVPNYLMSSDATPGANEPYVMATHTSGFGILELSHGLGANFAIRNAGAGPLYLQSAASQSVILFPAATQMLTATSAGVGIGTATSPTARLHLPAGTASASTAPIKFTTGTDLSTPEPAAVEYDGTKLAFTNSTAVRGTVLVIRSNVTAADPVTLATTYTHYVATGTTSTWTLPAVSGTANHVFLIKNRGSGTITLNAAAAANEIYTTSAVNTLAITAGSAVMLVSDGSFWNLE